MSEYPEHIDQIDDFYRSQLTDHEIDPPEGLWDKISMTAFETQSPEANATVSSASSSSRFTPAQKWIGWSAVTLLIVAGTLYFYSGKPGNEPTERNTIPAVEQPADVQQDSSFSPDTENSNFNESTKPQLKEQKTNSSSETQEKNITPPADKTSTDQVQSEAPVIINPPQEEQKADSVTEIKTQQKTPKEKVKFKDKYKKDYQDSTHKIFVPGK